MNAEPPADQYFKGVLFINTLRSIVNDDARWMALLHDFYQHFKYQNIMTEDVVAYFNQYTKMDLTPVFDQYLRHTRIPMLELLFDEKAGILLYKWQSDEETFSMPVGVGTPGQWQILRPTTQWQVLKTPLKKEDFQVDTDHYYVNVDKQ